MKYHFDIYNNTRTGARRREALKSFRAPARAYAHTRETATLAIPRLEEGAGSACGIHGLARTPPRWTAMPPTRQEAHHGRGNGQIGDVAKCDTTPTKKKEAKKKIYYITCL